MRSNMNEPKPNDPAEAEYDLAWATNIFEVIRNIGCTNETKIRVVNLLVQE